MDGLDPHDERIGPGLDDLRGDESAEQPSEWFPQVLVDVWRHEMQRFLAVPIADVDIGAAADEEGCRFDPAEDGG